MLEDEPVSASRSHASLSAATKQALAGNRAHQGYPKGSPSGKAIHASAVSMPHSTGRHAASHSLNGLENRSSQKAAKQQQPQAGLDSIFARMSPGPRDDCDRIDDDMDDDRDGMLLGDQEDSLYGSHYSKRDKQ